MIELRSGHVIGRKEHWCIWCGEVIKKGEKHLSRVYVFEGDFKYDRMHLECEKALGNAPRELELDLRDQGFEPGEFKRGTCISVNDSVGVLA